MESENKRKHLEFIQNAISRMAYNSFLLKGWSITIISALFVAASVKDAKSFVFLISLLPVLLFWLLDGFFLCQEWLFRALYDGIRQKKEDEIDFNMNIGIYKGGSRRWGKAVFSKTLLPYHGGLFLIVVLINILAYGKTCFF